MSLIATAVKHLLAAGVTGDALLSAIAELEAQVRAEPKPRSGSAIRMERKRERDRHNASQASHVTESDVCDESDGYDAQPSLPLRPNENNSNPTTPTHPEKPTPPARKGTRLPAGWEPAALDGPIADEVAAWPVRAIERELSKFRDWAMAAPGAKGVKSDWDATWRNWLRKAHEEGRYGNGTHRNDGRSPAPRNAGRPRDGAIAELDRQLGLDGFGEPLGRWDAGGGPGSGGRAVART